jgi:hypothetical protein
MKRHRRKCEIWKNRDKKAVAKQRKKQTNLKRYGVEDSSHLPEVQERRKKTNLERYGVENPMHNPEIAKKALENSGGPPPPRYGEDNHFSNPEVQARIRETWIQKYGVDNPQKSEIIREKTKKTTLERYGVEHILSSPEIRDQIVKTNIEKYGGVAPSCSPEIVEKARQTNQERFGVDWTCQDPEIRQSQLETMIENYGSHFFASEEGKSLIKESMLEKYGVEYMSQTEGFWERSQPKRLQTIRDRYGVDHPMQNSEIFMKQQERAGTGQSMNGFESGVFDICPDCVEYTGNKAFWRYLPKWNEGSHKNPDFVVRPFRENGCKVIECCGDYYHSLNFNGRTKEEYESEMVEAYRDQGIDCLVIWESDWKSDPNSVEQRIRNFIEKEHETCV